MKVKVKVKEEEHVREDFDTEKDSELVDYDIQVEPVENAEKKWEKQEDDCKQVERDCMRAENDCIVAEDDYMHVGNGCSSFGDEEYEKERNDEYVAELVEVVPMGP